MKTQQLGTKKFWLPFNQLSETQNQILRNSGYINIQLVSVSYSSKDSFFQSVFGGKDKIAISSSVTYGSGTDAIEATAVQDVQEVASGKSYILGVQRILAEKIPANANSLSISIKISAVKDDFLQAKFNMLNKDEYKGALKLLPSVVGQVLTITSLVKGLFTDSGDQPQLDASFAGIISQDQEPGPVSSGSLTQGLLFMIAANDQASFDNPDINQFMLNNYTLNYKGKPVENTYVVLRISFQQNKGEDQQSGWSKKYAGALENLNKLLISPDDKDKIKKDSLSLWIDGNALLDADISYINAEKLKLKAAALTAINDAYNVAIPTVKESSRETIVADVIGQLSGSTYDPGTLHAAFPHTGSLLEKEFQIKPGSPSRESSEIDEKADAGMLLSALSVDTANYLQALKTEHTGFTFNN